MDLRDGRIQKIATSKKNKKRFCNKPRTHF